MTKSKAPRGPIDGRAVPRFAGYPTFARLPWLDEIASCDIGLVGVPFDSGVTYRPGARFGPQAIRQGSRLLRPYHPGLDIEPFAEQQVADAGDIACNPFVMAEALAQIETKTTELLTSCRHLIALGGDHTVALPLLRAVNRKFGQVAVVHFDAHLDTWEGHFGVSYNHGTPFRRASEEGLIRLDGSIHVGVRGPIFSSQDLTDDRELGFQIIPTMDFERSGLDAVISRIQARIGGAPFYISIDIDVLDPAHAPGTGTPEAGGLTTRELQAVIRGLIGSNLIGADIVEVAPAYDHAEITAIAAANVVYELIALFARNAANDPIHQSSSGPRVSD